MLLKLNLDVMHMVRQEFCGFFVNKEVQIFMVLRWDFGLDAIES